MLKPPHLKTTLLHLIHYYTMEEILEMLAIVAEEQARQIPITDYDTKQAHRAWDLTARTLHRCTAMVRPYFT